MGYSWINWILICSIAVTIGYYRLWLSKIVRSRTAGLAQIPTSIENNTAVFEFFDQSKTPSYFVIKETTYANGLCGNLDISPFQRYCTPPLHVHLNQIEKFTLIQGQLGYQFGDEIHSCNVQTCPRPLIIPPGVKHSFWMSDNKEDLILMVQLEPIDSYYGVRRAFFENFGGVVRDRRDDIFQIFVIFDQAQVYPAEHLLVEY